VADGRDGRDRLHGATRRLAGGMGTVKARLRAALTPEVMALQADDFPWPDLGSRFDDIINEIAPDRRTHVVRNVSMTLRHLAFEFRLG
jgi:hypothetical protein